MARTLILLLLCAPALNSQTVSFHRPMLDELAAIADTATIEHARCLVGGWQGDTLYIVAAIEPVILDATPVHVATGPCPPIITWGEWHTHIPQPFTMAGEPRLGFLPPMAYCELSPLDRRAALRPDAPAFQVIHVNKDTSCAWLLVQGEYERIPYWPPKDVP